MAKRYIGLNRGNQLDGGITEADASPSKSIELVIDLADTTLTREDVLLALEAIEAYLIKRTWPLA